MLRQLQPRNCAHGQRQYAALERILFAAKISTRTAARFLAIALAATACLLTEASAAGTPDGIPETTHVLPAVYAQNIFLKSILSSYGQSDRMKLESVARAEEILPAFFSQPRMIVAAQSVSELEALEALHRPEAYTLSDELQIVKTQPPPYLIISPGSAEVRKKLAEIRERLHPQVQTLFSELDENSNRGPLWILARRTLFSVLDRPHEARGVLGLVPSPVRLELVNLAHQQFDIAFGKIDRAGEQLIADGVKNVPSPAWGRFFKIVLTSYFKNLVPARKADILSALIDIPPTAGRDEIFAALVLKAGPEFQKLMQIYANQHGFSSELQSTFKPLERGLLPAPWQLVEKQALNPSVPFEWLSMATKPFAVGTMAQSHRARILQADGLAKNVVVRLLKPEIRSRIHDDDITLLKVAAEVDADPLLREHNFPLMTPLLDQVSQMTLRESDSVATAKSQLRAKGLYTREISQKVRGRTELIRFRVPEVIESATTSDRLVQAFAEGGDFEEIVKSEPELARAVADQLARLWLEQALLESGFFHADLHPGNLLARRDSQGVVVNILDFGMTGQLDSKLQTQFLAYGAAMQSGDPDLLSRVLWELSIQSENLISREELKTVLIREKAALEGRKRTDRAIYDWAAIALNAGLRFPFEFTVVNRGLITITNFLAEARSENDATDIIKSLLIRHPLKVAAITTSIPTVSRAEWIKVIGHLAIDAARPAQSRPTVRGLRCVDLF